MARKIIHIDMDAFFAAIEQRDHPELRGQPVIVGGSPSSRGVVSTCSYEARRFGVRSAMPAAHAYRLCPQGIFVKGRMAVYKQVSEQIRAIFKQYATQIEPLSLDEAYLDVTHSQAFDNRAVKIARAIRQDIFEQTQLTASAGISYNKFLAKIASDINKPNGQKVILPEDALSFLTTLPIEKIHGIGHATAEKMHSLGIYTGGDLRQWPLEELQPHFGKMAEYYHNISHGIDHRPIRVSRTRKSIGAERTFAKDIDRITEMVDILQKLAENTIAQAREKMLLASTMTIKIKYYDFTLITRSKHFSSPIREVSSLKPWIEKLLADTDVATRPVRLLGVSFSHLQPDQASLHGQQSLDLAFDAP